MSVRALSHLKVDLLSHAPWDLIWRLCCHSMFLSSPSWSFFLLRYFWQSWRLCLESLSSSSVNSSVKGKHSSGTAWSCGSLWRSDLQPLSGHEPIVLENTSLYEAKACSNFVCFSLASSFPELLLVKIFILCKLSAAELNVICTLDFVYVKMWYRNLASYYGATDQ